MKNREMSEEIKRESAYHEITKEIQDLLNHNTKLLELWNSLTPIQRNEWICYTIMPKKQETKDKRLKRLQEDMLKGKKIPCCWPGCPHRRESAKKWFK